MQQSQCQCIYYFYSDSVIISDLGLPSHPLPSALLTLFRYWSLSLCGTVHTYLYTWLSLCLIEMVNSHTKHIQPPASPSGRHQPAHVRCHESPHQRVHPRKSCCHHTHVSLCDYHYTHMYLWLPSHSFNQQPRAHICQIHNWVCHVADNAPFFKWSKCCDAKKALQLIYVMFCHGEQIRKGKMWFVKDQP